MMGNTPKQCKTKFFKQEIIVPTPCKCQKEKIDEEEKRMKNSARDDLVKKLRQNGISEDKYLSMTFENDRYDNLDFARRYVDNWKFMFENNQGLILSGDAGVGKSYAASCIVNSLIDKGISACIINLPTDLEKLFDIDYKNNLYNKIRKSSFCVFDDLGAERQTDYILEQLYVLVELRSSSNKPLFVTTNLTGEQIKNARRGIWIDNVAKYQYKRIYDRICGMCKPYRLDGTSLRVMANKDKSDEAMKLLGIK